MYAAKAYVAAVIAALTAVLTHSEQLPVWLVIVLGALVAGLAAWVTPDDRTRQAQGRRRKNG